MSDQNHILQTIPRPLSPELEEHRQKIVEQIEAIRRDYQRVIDPLVEQLAHIESLRPPPLFVMAPADVPSWLAVDGESK